MPKDIDVVDLKLHGACIPDQDPFNPNSLNGASFMQYNCNNRSIAYQCNRDCSFCNTSKSIEGELLQCVGAVEKKFYREGANMSNLAAGDFTLRSFTTTRFRANPDRCTFYTVTSYFRPDETSGVKGADAACSNSMPLVQVVRDNKATKGQDCAQVQCTDVTIGDGNLTGLSFNVKCYDSIPARPGTPEGGPGWYLIESTWYNNQCKDSGLDSSVRLSIKHGECSLNSVTKDGTYIKLDLGNLIMTYYGAGDRGCKDTIRTESLKDQLKTDAPKCAAKYVCGGTTMYDLNKNDPATATRLDCSTNFVSSALERNSAQRALSPAAARYLAPFALILYFTS